MKKLLLIAGVFALILSSCTQDLPVAPDNTEQEVIFTSNDLKGFKADLYDCGNTATYALVYLEVDGTPIDGSPLTVPVFYVDDVMYTQAIKLPSGENGIDYTLTEFRLYDENDDIVNAVPVEGSEYGEMVSVTVPLDITVSPFTKSEIPLSILCYSPEQYEAFGFTWFRVSEEEITNKFFFGDFCTKFFLDYADDDYYGPETMVDMKAIFELTLSEKEGSSWNVIRTIDNLGDVDAGNSGFLLELIYPTDNTDDGDLFKIDIRIRVKVGDTFEFVNFGSWYFEDESEVMYTDEALTENAFDFGTDGVYDFILGNCNVNGADFIFAPYINLPESGSMTVASAYAPSANGGYLDIKLDFVGSGYDILKGEWLPTYCFDRGTDIYINTTYNVTIYSSLYPQNMPTEMADKEWDRVNWLANNLDQFEGYTWSDFQQAMWILEDPSWSGSAHAGVPAKTAMTDLMVAAAIANGDGYLPMPGGWAAVTFDNNSGSPIQTVFTIVDP